MDDGQVASFLPITRGAPHSTVLGTYLVSTMVNDIKTVSPSTSILVKYADYLTLSVLVNANTDTSGIEVENITKWADINLLNLNLKKTWEIIVRGRSNISLRLPAQTGEIIVPHCATLEEDRTRWDLQFQASTQ